MFDNHIYNLLTQLTEEHKSLWRIKNMYLDDLQEGCNKHECCDEHECDDCREFWEEMIEDKEDHIKKLTELLQKHLD